MLLLALPALADEALVNDAVGVVSRFHLQVTQVDGEPLGAAGWVLTRPDGSTVSAADAQLRTRAAALIPEGWPYASVPEYRAIVAFDEAWGTSPGAYTLTDGTGTWTFDWDPELVLATSLHLNPMGGRPDTPELLALVTTWNVDGPPIELADERWVVIDEADGTEVRSGAWMLRSPVASTWDDAYGNSFTLTNVYEADLAGLPEGTYHMVWQGVGRSWSFRVAADAWDTPFRTVLAGLLHQRCGIALPPELTRWARPACHLAPVERTTADYRVVGEDAFTALPAAATGEYVDAPGGYHDAADYDRNIGHLAVVHALVELYEADPERFAADDLGLPESGNGLGDVLDEALWGMTPWSTLQAEDGGVPGVIGTTAYPAYDMMPDEDTGPWYVTVSDPGSSYVFASAAAALSRAMALSGDDVAAADWLERAERAWSWAEAHPASSYDTSRYAAEAAAQLCRTTGDASYGEAFRANGPFAGGTDWDYAEWDPADWDDALWSIANADAAASDLRDAARRVLLARADRLVAGADARTVPLAVQPYAAVAFGSGSTPRESRLMFRAYLLTGGRDYLRIGTDTAAHTLGLNATGTSWVTGLGPNAVRAPLHTPSLADGIDDPVAGIVVYGPAKYDSSSGILGAALSAYSPGVNDWPLHERFADVAYVPQYNEFTVTESQAPAIYAFGFLAELAPASEGGDTGEVADTGGDLDEDPEKDGSCGCTTSGSETAGGALGFLLALAARRRARGRDTGGR